MSRPSSSAARCWANATQTPSKASTTWPLYTGRQGRYGEAEPLFEQALQLRREVLGATTPIPSSLNNLAVSTRARAAMARPSRSLSRPSSSAARCSGERHPDTLASLNNLAGLYETPGPLRRGRAAL